MGSLDQLQPASVWRHFQALCAIPHPSRHEQQIAAHILNFAQQLGLACVQDDVGNVIIRKQATPGYEQAPGVVLQAHMDMVPQKNSDTVHDFTTDPITAYVDGDWVTAQDTTLGADNGIGLAAALAVLESTTIQHGPLEALFTVNEESGMVGARGLQANQLKGDILINMDTEQEGELYVGCAGGTRLHAKAQFAMEPAPGGVVWRQLNLSGLSGGHSGADIHLGRGNAILLLTRVLRTLTNYGVRLASFHGGSLPNAIPREACAIIGLPVETAAECTMAIDMYAALLQNELKETEQTLSLTLTQTETPKQVLPVNMTSQWLSAVHACPNGVQRMSCAVANVVETSNNIGVFDLADGQAHVQMLARSLVDSAREELEARILGLFTLIGAESWGEASYPGWKPNLNSSVLALMQQAYCELFGKEATIKVVHAGLECGLLGGIYPRLDMISFGPTIKYPHSPDEKVHIESVEKFWTLLQASLKAIAEQHK